MRLRLLFILVLFFQAVAVNAQQAPGKDTVMKGATIEVLQAYKPEVRQAPKPEWVPQLPPPDTAHAHVGYDDVPQQSLYYTYSSLPLHPLALGKDNAKLPFPNYVALGGGNLSTIYLDAGIGGLYGKDYETAIHLHHISQKGDIENQQSALSGIEAEGMLHKDKTDWHAAVSAERDQYYYYGYNRQLYHYNPDSLRQIFTDFSAVVDMQNKDTSSSFLYHPSVNVSSFNAKLNTTETTVGFDLPFAYRFENNIQAQVAIRGSFTTLKTNITSTDNNYVVVLPGFSFDKSGFRGHALLGLAAGKDGHNYILPDIMAAYRLPETNFTIIAGIQSTLRQNTFQQLASENPYIYNNYVVKQMVKDEYFAGIEGGAGDHFTYYARGSYWHYKNMPVFVNDSGDQKQFNILYDDGLSAVSVQLGARYSMAKKWSAGLTGNFYHYSSGSTPYVFGEPDTRIKADLSVTPMEKLRITAYAQSLAGIWALDSYGRIIKLNAFTDIGASAEYQAITRISVFLQVSNLLNDQYQRWAGYKAYGVNIYGGLRLKF